MATLEDKILGDKQHNYCSSSESGEESGDEGIDAEDSGAAASLQQGRNTLVSNVPEPSKWDGVSTNTGPKGVLKDWQRFKQLEVEKRREQEAERLALMKKLSITCKSTLDEERDKKDAKCDEFAELLSDEFLEQYRKQRMHEMMSNSSKLPKFGLLHDLKSGDQFLEAVDNENKAVTVIVHIYEDKVPGCKTMNSCLAELSQEYVQVKFCKLLSTAAGMSNHFKADGVPALLVYKGGQVVGNFVRVTDDLGDEFYAGDVENFLIEHGMIVDRSCVPHIISGPKVDGNDSDVSLE
ncbi:phosducin-like protein [Homalodisca vitripennis]|uniref:Phosducin domain-containing protein n=1 Tax=Homalodisca liturata TaxID=320908 RepID=A0A1B6JIP9_9HEMI|nr:phosducin-like protein [Homalodisca vitripennis]